MDIFGIEMKASRHNGLIHNTMHHTIHGIKEIDKKMETKDGEKITLRENFVEILVPTTGNGRTNLIKRTESGPDNKVYLIYLREHNGIIKN